MTDTDTSVEPDIERLIRRALEAAADTSHIQAVEFSRRPRRHVALILAGIVAIVGLAGLVFVFAREPDNVATAPPPGWFDAIAPALPPGFEHVAVVQSDTTMVTFEAIDLETSKILWLNVERAPGVALEDPSAAMPLADFRAGKWTSPDGTPPILLPDNRTVNVTCAVVMLALMQQDDTCPAINGADVDVDQIRRLALALADMSVDVLPPQSSPLGGGVDRTTIAARAVTDTIDLAFGTAEEDDNMALITFGEHRPSGVPDLQVRVVNGFVPAINAHDGKRRSAEIGGTTSTWEAMPDSAVWIVTASSALPTGTTDSVLDAIVHELQKAPMPTLPLVPATSTPTPVTALFPSLSENDPRSTRATGTYSQVSEDNTPRARALVARIENDQMVDTIELEVIVDIHDRPTPLPARQPITIKGVAYDRYARTGHRFPLQTIVLDGDLDIAVTGTDPVSFIESAGGLPVTNPRRSGDDVSFDLGTLPAGYEVIVAPQALARGSVQPSVRIPSDTGGDGSFVTASVDSPLLGTAAYDEVLRRIDVNGNAAWINDRPAWSVVWQASPHTWIRAVMANDGTTQQDAIDFPRSIEFIDEATWQTRYHLDSPPS